MSTYRLTELHSFIRRVVALNLPEAVWVQGEIAEVDERRGHYYFTLIEKAEEADEILAQAQGMMWQQDARKWQRNNKALLAGILQAGRTVNLQVKVSFHERYGLKFQLVDLDPNYTLGVMAQRRQETIDALILAGLMDRNKQLQLAIAPQRIALISSPAAAGLQDFSTQLQQNLYGYDFKVQLFPAAMQGTQASPEIRRQLRAIERRRTAYDAIVIIRGGGSRIDLSDFDEKMLCFAAAESSLPIISGIGHETDQSIMDMLAYKALKTPTAVADFLIDRLLHIDQLLTDFQQTTSNIQQYFLQESAFKLLSLEEQLKMVISQRIEKQDWHLSQYAKQLPILVNRQLKDAREQLEHIANLHSLLSLESHLSRGFSVLTIDDKIVSKTTAVKEGKALKAQLQDGEIELVAGGLGS